MRMFDYACNEGEIQGKGKTTVWKGLIVIFRDESETLARVINDNSDFLELKPVTDG